MTPSQPSQELSQATSARRRIEREARRIVAETARSPSDGEPSIAVAREIALALEHLEELRRVQGRLVESLQLDELAVKKDVERLRLLVPWFSTEEAALHGRLLVIEERRRQLSLNCNDRMQGLFDDLLSKIQRFRQLEMPDEDG